MEKERGTKVIAIIALIVAIVGLSIGFAAFSKDLNITFLESSVTPSGTLDVKFLASDDVSDTTTVVAGTTKNGAISATDATISTDGATISNLSATFSDKGQSVEYDFYVYNNSAYDAYLKSVQFLNYGTEATNKVCTPGNGTDATLVNNACEDISLKIEIAGSEVTDTQTGGFTTPMIAAKSDSVDPIPVKIIIAYNSDDTLLPNGDFKINFGAIKLSYSSLEG